MRVQLLRECYECWVLQPVAYLNKETIDAIVKKLMLDVDEVGALETACASTGFFTS